MTTELDARAAAEPRAYGRVITPRGASAAAAKLLRELPRAPLHCIRRVMFMDADVRVYGWNAGECFFSGWFFFPFDEWG